ncbi:MAG: DUF4244 domain-containing protein [Actinomycetota bacterium]
MRRDWMVEARSRANRTIWELGQTTVEYALVILAAAGVALILINWAGGGGRLSELFDSILTEVFEKVSGAGG